MEDLALISGFLSSISKLFSKSTIVNIYFSHIYVIINMKIKRGGTYETKFCKIANRSHLQGLKRQRKTIADYIFKKS